MQIKKFINAAEELKLATLRAKEQGISGYREGEDIFNVFNDENFKKIAKDREYKIRRRFNQAYIYEYTVAVDGLVFTNITNKLLFDGDENKIAEDKNEGI